MMRARRLIPSATAVFALLVSVAACPTAQATTAVHPKPKCPHNESKSSPAGKRPKHCPAPAKKKPAVQAPTRTTSPGPVSLTSAELERFDSVNQERAAVHVAALVTSPELQAIAVKRAQEMAAMHADYAGHDVVVDLKDEGLCTRAQREISSFTPSTVAEETAEAEHRGADAHVLSRSRATAVVSQLDVEEQIALIPLDPTYKVIGVAVVESEGAHYYVEDFAEPC